MGSYWKFSGWRRDMARLVGHQSWIMYVKNNSNQREVGVFLCRWKNKQTKTIKLLPQLWVEIFAFSSRNTAPSSPLWFLCWYFLNLVLQAKLPDGSRSVHCHRHAHCQGWWMNSFLVCLTFAVPNWATLDCLRPTIMYGDSWAPLRADHFS